jgi:hypothetical protein
MLLRYETNDETAAVVEGNNLRILKVAPFVVTARQDGDATWLAADKPLTISPLKRPQKIAFTLKGKRSVGETFNLLVTINSPLSATVTSSNPEVVRVEGLTATVVGSGRAVLTAKQLGDESYAAAKEVKKTLVIK